jgi:hypothetical protein
MASSTAIPLSAARASAAGRAAPHRLLCARTRAYDRSRVRGGHVLDERGGAEAARTRAQRVLVREIDPAESSCESERGAQELAGTCTHDAAFVGRVKALVEMEVELKKAEAGGRREKIGYDGGEAARSLKSSERTPSKRIGRLCVRELTAYMQRES